jgi:hypothetical protein
MKGIFTSFLGSAFKRAILISRQKKRKKAQWKIWGGSWGRTIILKPDNIIDKPNITGLQYILIPINLLLAKSPLRQRLWMSPHSHPRRNMNQLEQPRLCPPHGTSLSFDTLDLNRKQRIIIPFPPRLFEIDGREFLVCGVIGRRDVMRQQVRFSSHMA